MARFDRPLELSRLLGRPCVLGSLAGVLRRSGDARAAGLVNEAVSLLVGRADSSLYEAVVVAEEAVEAGGSFVPLIADWVSGADPVLHPACRVNAVCGRWSEALAQASAAGGVVGLLFVARTASKRGITDVADQAFDLALGVARSVVGRNRGWRLRDVGVALAEAGRRERLGVVVGEAVEVAAREHSMMTQLAVLLAQAGDAKAARAAVKKARGVDRCALSLAVAKGAYQGPADVDNARELEKAAHEALQTASTMTKVSTQASLICDAAEALISIGDKGSAAAALREASRAMADCDLSSGLTRSLLLRVAHLVFGLVNDASPLHGTGLELVERAARVAEGEREVVVSLWSGEHTDDIGGWNAPLGRYASLAGDLAFAFHAAGHNERADELLSDALHWLEQAKSLLEDLNPLQASWLLQRW